MQKRTKSDRGEVDSLVKIGHPYTLVFLLIFFSQTFFTIILTKLIFSQTILAQCVVSFTHKILNPNFNHKLALLQKMWKNGKFWKHPKKYFVYKVISGGGVKKPPKTSDIINGCYLI